MGNYIEQTLLTISLDTNQDLDGADVKKIICRKPDETIVEFDATANGQKLEYDFQEGDLDQSGWYTFQAYIEVGGLKGYGDPVKKKIKKRLEDEPDES